MSIKKHLYKIILNHAYLFNAYWVDGKTTIEIAKEKNCSHPTISLRMKRLGIPLRTPSQRKSGDQNPSFGKKGPQSIRWGMKHSEETKKKISNNVPSGPKHLRWKPPNKRIEPVNNQIRNCYKMRAWREKVFYRDGYACVLCRKLRSADVIINADHIKPFAIIKKENSLISLKDALLCGELWDISNGQTLCESCHRKTSTWGARTKKLLSANGEKK